MRRFGVARGGQMITNPLRRMAAELRDTVLFVTRENAKFYGHAFKPAMAIHAADFKEGMTFANGQRYGALSAAETLGGEPRREALNFVLSFCKFSLYKPNDSVLASLTRRRGKDAHQRKQR